VEDRLVSFGCDTPIHPRAWCKRGAAAFFIDNRRKGVKTPKLKMLLSIISDLVSFDNFSNDERK